jgi:hypothetical protein
LLFLFLLSLPVCRGIRLFYTLFDGHNNGAFLFILYYMYKNGSIIVTGNILGNETNGTITFLPVSDAFNVVKY